MELPLKFQSLKKQGKFSKYYANFTLKSRKKLGKISKHLQNFH